MFRANVLRREIRLSRRGLVIWGAVTGILILVYLGFFPYMKDPDLLRALEAYPEELLAALNLNAAVLGDVNHYHGGMVMTFVLLLAVIYGLMLAGGLVSRDADLGTAEFLYTRPATRGELMAAKVAAFLAGAVALWIAVFAFSTAVGLAVAPGEFDLGIQAIVHLAGLLATIAAGGVAFAAAPFIDRMQGTTSLAVGIGLGFFLLDSVSRMTDKLAPLKYLSVQHYAALDGAATGDPWWGGMLVLVLVFIGGTALGCVFLNRKEFTG